MSIIEKKVGTYKNQDIYFYTLKNKNGMEATFTNLGGTNVSIKVKTKSGELRDIMLAYDEIDKLAEDPCFFGAIIARNGNRIARATATIAGKDYKLDDNDNGNNLHSGLDYFHNKVLDVEKGESNSEDYIIFKYKFKDMEQGYPGNMDFSVRYKLTSDNELKITYKAKADKDTIFNPTWHGYFNFAGHGYGKLDTHEIKLEADEFTYVSNVLIPEKLEKVAGTALDFTSFRNMFDRIDDEYVQIVRAGGFDHNFAIKDYDGKMRLAATVKEKTSGLKMEVYTTLPGIQFYSGNFIDVPYVGKENVKYVKRGGFCLETQCFPNAVNDDRFVSPIIKAGVEKELNTIYKFIEMP